MTIFLFLFTFVIIYIYVVVVNICIILNKNFKNNNLKIYNIFNKKYIYFINKKKCILYNQKIQNQIKSIIQNDIDIKKFRFAPSPTGNLHVGGCRTFLYNYILAKQMKGILILRFEDTDINRNDNESKNSIINDLKWLGLKWDEGPDKGGPNSPYNQSEKIEYYKNIAHDLVKEEKAYFCFCSKDELKEKKDKAKSEKKKYYYDRKCRYLNNEIIKNNLKQNKLYTIRFKSPINKKIVLKDILKNDIIDVVNEDFIILRSNKLPTYNFTASVDDHLMKITHVVRGIEHITNTFKQILILESLNANIPYYAHIPVITTADKKKISKRKNYYTIKYLREEGFKPECIINYLVTLGCGNINKKEIYSLDELIKDFDIKYLNKASSVFDLKKLKWMNKIYLLNEDNNTYIKNTEEYLINNKIIDNNCIDFVKLCIDIFKNDSHNLGELKENIFQVISYTFDTEFNKDNYIEICTFLFEWLNEYEKYDIEITLQNDFNKIIEKIIEKYNLKKNEVLLKLRYILTFQKKGIPFINLLQIWNLAKKRKLKNYITLKERIMHLKKIYNY